MPTKSQVKLGDVELKLPEGDRGSESGSKEKSQGELPRGTGWFNLKLPANLQWIPSNCTWTKIKPVIRSAVAAWISAVLFAIPKVELFMGQVRDTLSRTRAGTYFDLGELPYSYMSVFFNLAFGLGITANLKYLKLRFSLLQAIHSWLCLRERS